MTEVIFKYIFAPWQIPYKYLASAYASLWLWLLAFASDGDDDDDYEKVFLIVFLSLGKLIVNFEMLN